MSGRVGTRDVDALATFGLHDPTGRVNAEYLVGPVVAVHYLHVWPTGRARAVYVNAPAHVVGVARLHVFEISRQSISAWHGRPREVLRR
jgi:hypothetical protein